MKTYSKMRDRNQSLKRRNVTMLGFFLSETSSEITTIKLRMNTLRQESLVLYWEENYEKRTFCFQLKLTNINLQMCNCMFLTIASVRETFTTDLALVWIKPLMDSEMSFQISTVWESLRAVYTCIWFGAFEVLLRPIMPRVTNNVGLYEIWNIDIPLS